MRLSKKINFFDQRKYFRGNKHQTHKCQVTNEHSDMPAVLIPYCMCIRCETATIINHSLSTN